MDVMQRCWVGLLCLAALVACGDDETARTDAGGRDQPDAHIHPRDAGDDGDAAGASESRDGTYRCRADQDANGGCSGAFFDNAAPDWMVELRGAKVEFMSEGIKPGVVCEGTWSDSVLECTVSYTRSSGRTCRSTFYVRAEEDGTLTVGYKDSELSATCRKQ